MRISIKKDFLVIVALFILWRSFLFIIAYIAPNFLPTFGAKFPYYNELLISTNLPQFIWSFANFDGVHYLRIAQDGYAYQYTQAFFPLYPILIKSLSNLTFGNYLIAALLISNASFLLALITFYKLVKKNLSEKIAFWSVLFLLSFPTSFYFGAVYTESIFLLAIILFFLSIENKNFLHAAVVAALASSLRVIGILLAPIIFIAQRTKTSAIYTCLGSSGLAIYAVYLWFKFNNPLYFLTAQSVWGQERTTTNLVFLPQVFYRYFKIIVSVSGTHLYSAIFELTATILAIALLVKAINSVKKEWLIFSMFAIVIPTLTGTLASMPRYILIAFPIYIALAQIKSTLIKSILVVISSIALSICTTIFTRGYWIA